MDSYEKKIREAFKQSNAEVSDQKFKVWGDLDYIDSADALVAIANVKKEVLEELGKVARKIWEQMQFSEARLRELDQREGKQEAAAMWEKGYIHAKEQDLGLLVESSTSSEILEAWEKGGKSRPYKPLVEESKEG